MYEHSPLINRLVKVYGKAVIKQFAKNPEQTRKMLVAALNAVRFQTRHMPNKRFIPARDYMLGTVSDGIALCLKSRLRFAVANISMPCELLHAMGIYPLVAESFAHGFSVAAVEQPLIEAAENRGVPESLCSYHKVFIGAAESGILPRPEFVVHTAFPCDANRLSFTRVADFYDIPRFCIDVPRETGVDAAAYVADQLRKTVGFIEECTGKEMNCELLKVTLGKSRDTLRNYKKFLKLRQTRSVPTDMLAEMMQITSNHILLGTDEAKRFAELLVEDAERRPEKRVETRLVWMHVMPAWQESLIRIFMSHKNVELLGCDLAFNALTEPDPERPFESLAERLLTSTLNGPAERRIDTALSFARDMDADGLIFFNSWGCKATLGAAQLTRKKMESNNLPTLLLDGDGCNSGNINDGQMVTRVEAFLEQLGAAK